MSMKRTHAYLIRKFIALNRHADFAAMKNVYTEKDLFASYLTLTLMNRDRLQRTQQLMKLTPDDHKAFERVVGIIGEQYLHKEGDNLDLFASRHKQRVNEHHAGSANSGTRMRKTMSTVRNFILSFFHDR